MGTILNALKFQKPIIIIFGRKKYGELNIDDHQIEIVQRLEGIPLIHVFYEVEDLEEAVTKILSRNQFSSTQKTFPERERLRETVKHFLRGVG